MTTMEVLIQAILAAPEDRKAAALRVLRGEAEREARRQEADGRNTESFLTLKECGRRLGVSACSLWRWRVPGHELGGRPKFRMSEVEAYLQSDAFRKRAAELREEDRERREKQKTES
jgi:hypothetical protein